MSDNAFFVTLESNADLDNHPDNTQNKFKVTLQSPIELQGQWETGLAQLIFPHSWHERQLKITENDHNLFAIKLHVKGDGKDDSTSYKYWRNLYITPLNYHTIKDLLVAMQQTINLSQSGAIDFFYRQLKSKTGGQEGLDPEHLRINPSSGDSFLCINLQLAAILSYDLAKIRREKWKQGVTIQKLYGGLSQEWLLINYQRQQTSAYAERQFLPAPLSQHISIKIHATVKDAGLFQNMYINSDLIETQFIGNTRANVLRVIAPIREKGQIETFNFDPIFYSPLRVTKFTTIEINITGDTGQLVPFDGGVVVIVLHLRRKHNILV